MLENEMRIGRWEDASALFERVPSLRRECGLIDQTPRVEAFCSLDVFLARLDLGLRYMIHEEEDGYEHR